MPPPTPSLAVGFEEAELDVVMGCDSAARTTDVSVSAGLVDSATNEVDRDIFGVASLDCSGSRAGPSNPFSRGDGVWVEPAALERPELSFVIAISLQEKSCHDALPVAAAKVRFPQVRRARSAGKRGYRTMAARL